MREVAPLRSRDPQQVGPYRLEAVLGTGGQGTVYLARDSQSAYVAVKVLHAGSASDERAMRRFVSEVDAARQVAPFCTARILDVAVTDSVPYIVSEYIPGESLRTLIERDGPREAGALERLAINTASALTAIHQAGIVHRDFKPGNILMGPDGPRVIDFGIARALDRLTIHSSALVGTPVYMSPEQIAGNPVGPASDMFSWGVTLTYAATGAPAFGDDSVPAVMHRILTAEPDLSAFTQPLRGIVEAVLAKDPDSRPRAADILPGLLHGRARVASEPLATVAPPPLPTDSDNARTTTAAPVARSAASTADAAAFHEAETRMVVERAKGGPRRRTVLLGTFSALFAGGGSTAAYLATRSQSPAIPRFGGLLGHASAGSLMVAISPDGKLLASANQDGTVGMWAVESGDLVETLTGHQGDATAVAFSPDGGTLASGSFDRTVRLWRVPGGQPLAALTGHTDYVWSVAFSQDGGSIASGGVDHTVRIWSTASRLQTAEFDAGATIYSVAFSPGGTTLAIGCEGGVVHLWDFTASERTAVLTSYGSHVRSVAYSPDGKRLATGSFDGNVRLWNPATRQNIATLTGHTDGVMSVAYAPHTATLASGSLDGTARLWDLDTGATYATLNDPMKPRMPNAEIYSVTYSPDGKRLATASLGGNIETWRM